MTIHFHCNKSLQIGRSRVCHFYTVVLHLIYGGLRGMILWSLVKAEKRGGDVGGDAPGSGADRVGVNLIVAQLENWKARVDEAGIDVYTFNGHDLRMQIPASRPGGRASKASISRRSHETKGNRLRELRRVRSPRSVFIKNCKLCPFPYRWLRMRRTALTSRTSLTPSWRISTRWSEPRPDLIKRIEPGLWKPWERSFNSLETFPDTRPS